MAECVEDVSLEESKDSNSNDSGCILGFKKPIDFESMFKAAQDVPSCSMVPGELGDYRQNQSNQDDDEDTKYGSAKHKRTSFVPNRSRCRSSHPYNLSNLKERKLRMAVSVCNLEEVTRLLECGTNPNCTDEYKRSPLHLAACRGYTTIVTELLKFGANPNIVDMLGNTPMHLAVISASSNNFNKVVKILLDGGASVHMLDRGGKNPLDLAKSRLRLIRSRFTSPTPEVLKILNDMAMLIYLIAKQFIREQEQMAELEMLEKRLEGLSTQDEVTTETDLLLANIERLTISK